VSSDLPSGSEKLSMLSTAITYLDEVGYDYIGMDHFALPDDSLSVAKRQGRLHRNFQGYSTQPDCDLLALGVSAIGRMGNTYSQNAKTIDDYSDALDQERLPIVRGLVLALDDIARRALIMAIMCRGCVDFQSFESSYLLGFKKYFSRELAELNELADQGLVVIDAEGFRVTDQGWFFVRAIAMIFDRYLRDDVDRARFSKII
jgi:oxygen-independent coproporphyrinogen-3 oxidase